MEAPRSGAFPINLGKPYLTNNEMGMDVICQTMC